MYKNIFLISFFACFTLITHGQTHSLDFYLKEDLQNSPLLNDFRNQINSALADSLLIRAAKKPLVEAKSQLQYSTYTESKELSKNKNLKHLRIPEKRILHLLYRNEDKKPLLID